jgi:hypothetical protein
MKLTKHIRMHGDNTISIFCVDEKNRLQGFSESYDEKVEPFGKSKTITRAASYKDGVHNGLFVHSWEKELEVRHYKNSFRFGQVKNGLLPSEFRNFYPPQIYNRHSKTQR